MPWKECDDLQLLCDDLGCELCEPIHNDDRVNIHNPQMLSIWRENIDCQPVTSRLLVLKYITKYTSKVEKKSESCVNMLSTICLDANEQDNVVKAYQKFIVKIVSERDISAQETYHMLQKLTLVMCN